MPATHKPAYGVAGGIRCVPPNDLVHIEAPPSTYVVVGAGKTASIRGWSRDNELRTWIEGCRLNIYRGMAELAKTDAATRDALQRVRDNAMLATLKLQQFCSQAELQLSA